MTATRIRGHLPREACDQLKGLSSHGMRPLPDDLSTPAPRPRRYSPALVEALAAYTAGVQAARDDYAPRAVREVRR